MLDEDKDRVVDKADIDIEDLMVVVGVVKHKDMTAAAHVMAWADVMVWVVANRQAF